MNIQSLEIQLKSSKSLQELEAVLQSFLSQYKISNYAFTYYSKHPNSQNKIKYSHASKPYKVWHEHYRDEYYDDVDTTMTEVYRSTMPVHWDLQQQLAEAKTEREKQMRLDSMKYGAEKGVCVPIHGPFEDFSTFVFVQVKGESFLNQWENIQHEIIAAAQYYYAYLKNLLLHNQMENDDHDLSHHQVQCLMLTSKQYNVDEIAKKLGITTRTVNFHLQKANKKLGTKNKHQSVAKGIEKGIF